MIDKDKLADLLRYITEESSENDCRFLYKGLERMNGVGSVTPLFCGMGCVEDLAYLIAEQIDTDKEDSNSSISDFEILDDMYNLTQKYFDLVCKEQDLTDGEDWGFLDVISLEAVELALMVEAGEMLQELKGNWCFWKKTKLEVDWNKALEEFVDVLHFAFLRDFLEGSNAACRTITEYLRLKRDKSYTGHNFIDDKGKSFAVFNQFQIMGAFGFGDTVARALMNIQNILGLELKDIYEAFKKKNEINVQRLKEGY